MEYLIYNIDTLTNTEYEKWFSLMTEEEIEKLYAFFNQSETS